MERQAFSGRMLFLLSLLSIHLNFTPKRTSFLAFFRSFQMAVSLNLSSDFSMEPVQDFVLPEGKKKVAVIPVSLPPDLSLLMWPNAHEHWTLT